MFRLNTISNHAFLVAIVAMSQVSIAKAAPVFSPGGFTVPVQVIDYENSPVGVIPGSTSVVNQYSSLGVIHDGSTTTPPGPPGMSSNSGLPGLESEAGDPDPNLPITITFTTPVTQVGAFYLMGNPSDSISLQARRADNSVIESATVIPANMPLQPGPFNFNEGFLGLIVSEPIAAVTFSPATSVFVIDDLHFGIPEPSTLGLAGLSLLGLIGARRRVS